MTTNLSKREPAGEEAPASHMAGLHSGSSGPYMAEGLCTPQSRLKPHPEFRIGRERPGRYRGRCRPWRTRQEQSLPGPTLEATQGQILKSIPHRCQPILVALPWELTEEAIGLPLGCLQGGTRQEQSRPGLHHLGEGLRFPRSLWASVFLETPALHPEP